MLISIAGIKNRWLRQTGTLPFFYGGCSQSVKGSNIHLALPLTMTHLFRVLLDGFIALRITRMSTVECIIHLASP